MRTPCEKGNLEELRDFCVIPGIVGSVRKEGVITRRELAI